MKQTIYIIFLFIFFGQEGYAQQLSMFAQYRDYAGLINPAMQNIEQNKFEQYAFIGGSMRRQWTSLPSTLAPVTSVLQGSYAGEAKHSETYGLVGGYILRDKTGPSSVSAAYLRGAVGLNIGTIAHRDVILRAGINLGLINYEVRLQELYFNDPASAAAALPSVSRIFPDVGLGILIETKSEKADFFAGLSIPQVVQLDFANSSNDDIQISRIKHFYLLAGTYIPYGSRGGFSGFWEISSWTRYVPSIPLNYDLNIRNIVDITNNSRLWGGVGFSFAKNYDLQKMLLHFETGVGFFLSGVQGFSNSQSNQVRIGYAYDLYMAKYSTDYGNSHEFTLSFSF